METVVLATYAMHTRFEIVLHGGNPIRLRSAGEEALREIERLHSQLSLFEPTSDISKINAHAASHPVQVEPRLYNLLKHCFRLSELTEGAFDITIGELMHIWGFHCGETGVPKTRTVQLVSQATNERGVILCGPHMQGSSCGVTPTVSFERPGIRLDLGAIGKGYAIERAVEILRDAGIVSAIIHGGTSTVYGIGRQQNGEPWRVGVRTSGIDHSVAFDCQSCNDIHEKSYATPTEHVLGDARPANSSRSGGLLAVFELTDSALSVSKTFGRQRVHDGTVYGHELDPRTGQPIQEALTAVVTGPSPTECDALSTALIVLGDSGVDLIRERFPGYQARIEHAQ
ncbi:MAG: FAD:protein FMN transferase [Armatimonadota bacterium]